jgi:hypothetical protein
MEKEAVSGIILTLLLILTFPASLCASSAIIIGRNGYRAIFQIDSTQVSGFISENTTWTLAGSPYIVVGDVIVYPDVFLTIEPGVSVKFTAAKNLVIDGGLIAQGNPTHRITFTSNSSTPSRGDWGTINIRDYSTPTNLLENVQIEYASTALTLAANCNITASSLEKNNNAISLQDVENVYVGYVQINNTGGISGSLNGDLRIESSSFNGGGIGVSANWTAACYVKNSTFMGGGIGCSPSTGGGSRLEVDNCSVDGGSIGGSGFVKITNSNISNGGVSASGAPENVCVENCTITNGDGLRIGGYVTNCTISGNSRGIEPIGPFGYGRAYVNGCRISGSDVGIYLNYRCSATVYGCNISNNRDGMVLEYDSWASVSDSAIRNNIECGVRLRGYLDLHGSIVENNLYGLYGADFAFHPYVNASASIIRNSTIGVMAEDLEAYSTAIANNSLVGVTVNSLEAHSTTIANNSLVNVQAGSGTTLEYCSIYNSLVGIRSASGSIKYSNIYNHTEYNVENEAGVGNDIDATHNWWGTTNETLIEELIYDYYDDYNLGRVLYKPYLSAPLEIDTAPPSIGSISRLPTIPNYDEDVVASSTIMDNVEVDQALLSYTQDLLWHNVSMNRFGNVFNATIPSQPYGTAVQYKIYADDTNGNWATSGPYSYTVGDFLPPEVDLSQSPAIPQSSQAVRVYANVTEPVNASGVQTVLFSYRVNGGPWVNTTMILNEGLQLYETAISQQQPTALIEYFVKAIDNAGNVNTTTTHNYVVALAGDVNLDHTINVFDILAVKSRWGTTPSSPNWIPEYDINDDGSINVFDILLIKANWGKSW